MRYNQHTEIQRKREREGRKEKRMEEEPKIKKTERFTTAGLGEQWRDTER